MKPVLLILHGALGCKQQFVQWAQILSSDFDCRLLDFSGHGTKSAEEKEFSIRVYTE